jgi:hypothetical protein
MPDQLLTYSIENPLMIISINILSCGVMVIRLVIDYGELVRVTLKKGWVVGIRMVGWVESYRCCWGLWPVCVFRCVSVAVMEGVCVRDCRRLGLCMVGRVG